MARQPGNRRRALVLTSVAFADVIVRGPDGNSHKQNFALSLPNDQPVRGLSDREAYFLRTHSTVRNSFNITVIVDRQNKKCSFFYEFAVLVASL